MVRKLVQPLALLVSVSCPRQGPNDKVDRLPYSFTLNSLQPYPQAPARSLPVRMRPVGATTSVLPEQW